METRRSPVGLVATGMGVVCLGFGTVALVMEGAQAFELTTEGWGGLSGPLAALVVAPLFLWMARLADSIAEDPVADNRMLRQSMRVETVGDMAGMVAHQLRNHLQIVTGQVALAQGDEGPERDQRLRAIQQEVTASTELLEQLLELAHPGDGEAVSLDLAAFCRDFGTKVRKILPTAIEFEVATPDTPVMVTLDPHGLQHALLNLVINARHAIDGRGRLTLSVQVESGTARIDVDDTGHGIDGEHLQRVFEPYFTTKPKGKGTGLGLAAVQRYVRQSSGWVDVDSAVGKGTRFQLGFPLAG